jgi:hypothetical protein
MLKGDGSGGWLIRPNYPLTLNCEYLSSDRQPASGLSPDNKQVMRLSDRFAPPLLAGVVLFLGIALPSLVTAETVSWRAQVQSVKGKATWSTNAEMAQPLKVNSILPPGSTVKTGPDSSVDLFLGHSAGVVRLGPDTTLALDKLTMTDTGGDKVVDVQLNLPVGEMYFNVNKLSKASRYEIKVPNGVAGIRGTVFFLSASGILRVISGSVVVAYVGPGGNVITQIVNAGEQFDTNTGLVTPIMDNVGIFIRRAAFAFRVFANRPVTFIAPDLRVYFVSPVNGRATAGGGDGGGDGEVLTSAK